MNTAPMWESREWALGAGRSLMRWWNGQGAQLPGPGESYRVWWLGVDEELREDLVGPSDVGHNLKLRSEEARAWWRQNGRPGSHPPMFDVGAPLESVQDAVVAPGRAALMVAAAAALLYWIATRRP